MQGLFVVTSTASSRFFFVDEERRMTGIVALHWAKTLMKMFLSYITLGYVFHSDGLIDDQFSSYSQKMYGFRL